MRKTMPAINIININEISCRSADLGYRLDATRHRAARILTILTVWLDRARQRRRLAELDNRQLQDIGLDREAARREAIKPFWRA